MANFKNIFSLLFIGIIRVTYEMITESHRESCSGATGHIDINFLTYKTMIMGCGTTVKVSDITEDQSVVADELSFVLTPATNRQYVITAVSHKKKQDKIFVAAKEVDIASQLQSDSHIFFIPDYKDGLQRFTTAKIYTVPDMVAMGAPPEVIILEAVPDNSYFITADLFGQIFVWDSDLTDNSPAFFFETAIGKPIVNIKFRSLATQFMVGLRFGTALIHITNLIADPPIVITHRQGIELSAIEVFKYSKIVMTGGADGSIKRWDADTQAELQVYNTDGSVGGEVADISWLISSNFFVSAHIDFKLNVWRVESVNIYVEGLEISNIPNYIAAYANENAFYLGTTNVMSRFNADSLRCHDYCKTCNGFTQFDCITCFDGYELETTGFCKAICPPGPTYLNISLNYCEDCSTGCQSCIGGRDIDCLVCQSDHYQHPNRSCHTECQYKTYFDSTTNSCERCHPTCATCSSGKIKACLECNPGLMKNIDGTCTPKCFSGTFNKTATECYPCHESCMECNGTLITNCLECKNKSIEFLSEDNKCIDCLNSYLDDPKTCEFTKKALVVRTPYEAIDAFSSLSIKVHIEGLYEKRRIIQDGLDWGLEYFDVIVAGLEPHEYVKKESIIRGSFVINLNFTRTLDDRQPITVISKKRDWLLANLTNKEIFMVQRLNQIWPKNIINMQVNKKSSMYVQTLAGTLNFILMALGLIMIVLAFVMVLMSFDITYLLVDFTRMAKVIHRLKFISADQTPLVEYFLASTYNIYQSGLDQRRDDVDIYQTNYRGRLTEIGVPVFPLVNFSDKYLIYLVTNFL